MDRLENECRSALEITAAGGDPCDVLDADGVRVTIPPNGTVARVATEETVVSTVALARAVMETQ